MGFRYARHLVIAAAFGLLSSTPALAQQTTYTINGSVLSAGAAEQPLSGARVAVRGTGQQTVTGDDGRFTLQAQLEPGTYALTVSLIGHAQATRSVELAGERTVTLEPIYLEVTAVQLEDLVVTGVGVESERRALGNTVETITGGQVTDAPAATSLDIALQGKITGAVISQSTGQAGGGTSVRLRGTSTILGDAEPLYVIDGVVVDNSTSALVGLNANATTSNSGISNRIGDLVPGDIERIEVLKGAAAAGLYGSRANSGVIQIFTKEGRSGAPRVSVRSEFTASQTPNKYDLNMAPYAGLADVVFGPATTVGEPVDRFDIQDELFRTGLGTSNYLSIAGGTPETEYFVSGSYDFQEGIFRANDNEKVNVRAKISQQVADELRVTANANYIETTSSFVPEGEQIQGPLTNIIFTPTNFDYSFDPDLGRYPYSPILGANPLDVVENWDATEDVTRFIGALSARWQPLEELTLRYQFGLDDYRFENRYLQPPGATSPAFTGSVQNPVRFSRQINSDLTAQLLTPVGETMTLTSTGGLSYTSDNTETVRAGASDLPPGQTLVGGATQFASQSISEVRTLGGFLQEQLGIDDRLFLTAGVNLEAASAFGPDERLQAFPRASVSYLLSEEEFWNDEGLFSTLRLRAAYGETGGQPPGAYLRFDNFINTEFAGLAGLRASTLIGNPDLKPERQREFEAGLEVGAFDDRAMLELTGYTRRTFDLVLPVPVAPSRGFQTQFQNIGEITNRGVEAALSTVNVEGDDLTWSSRLQVASNSNRVEQLVTATDTIGAPGRGYPNFIIEGEPLGVFYGGFYEREDDGSIAHDEDGLPVRATDEEGNFASKILGNPHPDLVISLRNDLEIGGRLRVGVLLDGRLGQDVANFTRRITEFFGTDAVVEREIAAEGAEPDTVPGTYTLNGTRIGLYEEYIEDGSFVKLREISASFGLPASLARSLGAQSASIRGAARNLVTWTDYSGLDPEINMFAAHPAGRNVDFANTPVARTYVFGVNLSF